MNFSEPDRSVSIGIDQTRKHHADGDTTPPKPNQTKSRMWLPEIPGMDITAATLRLRGDVAFLTKLLDLFAAKYATSPRLLRALYAIGDLAGIKEHVHSLKGAALTISAEELVAVAEQIETILAEEGSRAIHASDRLPELFKRLESSLVPMIETIKQVFRSSALNHGGNAFPDGPAAVDSSGLQARYRKLDNLLRDNDLAALNAFEALKHALPPECQEQLQELSALLAKLDFASARLQLREIVACAARKGETS
jgi:HPt (histidine-containing phosphotransfer) domain-containing protein